MGRAGKALSGLTTTKGNKMKTEIKTILRIGAFVGKWPRLLTVDEIKEVESYVSEGRDPCPELIAKAEAIMRGLQVGDREIIELRKDKRRLDWLLGDTGSRYVEKDMALGTWDASEVFETREGIDRVMELEGGDVEQRGLWRWHNAEPEQNIPEELFDGNAVYDELTQAERRYTTPAAVSAVLDATVSLIRMGIKKGGEV